LRELKIERIHATSGRDCVGIDFYCSGDFEGAGHGRNPGSQADAAAKAESDDPEPMGGKP